MTPKEKAEALIKEFKTDIVEELLGSDELYHYTAKHCAIRCSDKVISALKDGCASEGGFYNGDQFIKYWKNVKQEIEKL